MSDVDQATAGTKSQGDSNEITDAVKRLLDIYGQNQAALAGFADVAPATVSNLLASGKPPPGRAMKSWEKMLKGLTDLIATKERQSNVPDDEVTRLMSLVGIRERILSLPGDPVRAEHDNYISRTVDTHLASAVDRAEGRIIELSGGHKMGNTSAIGKVSEYAKARQWSVIDTRLRNTLAIKPDWERDTLYAHLCRSLSIKVPQEVDDIGLVSYDMIEEIEAKWQGRQFLIVIDNYDYMVTSQDVDVKENQITAMCELFILFDNIVNAVRLNVPVICIFTGPMAFFETPVGGAFHQSRSLPQRESLRPLSKEQCKGYFQAVTGADPDNRQLESLSTTLGGHPYFVHAALQDLKLSGTRLPDNANEFVNNQAVEQTLAVIKSSVRVLCSPGQDDMEYLQGLVSTARTSGSSSERITAVNLACELGLGLRNGDMNLDLFPVFEPYFRGNGES